MQPKGRPAWDCGVCETTGPTANRGSKPQCEAVPEGADGGAQGGWKSSSFPQHLGWLPSVCTLPLAGEGYDVPDSWQTVINPFLRPQPSVPQGHPVPGGQRLFVLSLGSISCP